MSITKDFDTLKRKVMLAYHQDGIIDLVASSVILGFGFNMLTGNIAFLLFGWLSVMFYIVLKQRITIPRFGYVRFVPKEENRTQLWFLLGVGMLVLFVFIFGSIFQVNKPGSPEVQAWMQQYHMVPLSAMLFGLPTLVAAVILGLKRFYLYTLLAVGLPALGAWVNIETFVPILTTGIVMLVFGIGLLTSFLKKYQINNKADGNVSR